MSVVRGEVGLGDLAALATSAQAEAASSRNTLTAGQNRGLSFIGESLQSCLLGFRRESGVDCPHELLERIWELLRVESIEVVDGGKRLPLLVSLRLGHIDASLKVSS